MRVSPVKRKANTTPTGALACGNGTKEEDTRAVSPGVSPSASYRIGERGNS